MATTAVARSPKSIRRWPFLGPSVGLLLIWMIVPLAMTIWFAFQRYNLVNPTLSGFAGFENFKFLLTDPVLPVVVWNTIVLVGAVLIISVVLGVLFAVLFDQPFAGSNIARLLVITPFFVMPTVSALVWKNLLMHPVNGLFAYIGNSLGFGAIDWFNNYPLTGIIMIVAWQWIPFATLILLTAIQSLPRDLIEAARMDGAGVVSAFFHITLPHLGRAIAVVVMIETIFLLQIFAEILVTTSGGPGQASMNLPFLVYMRGLLEFDIGGASAAGLFAVVIANIVAAFLIRTIGKTMRE
jgi:sorbitol/mannitol transport system permease protein